MGSNGGYGLYWAVAARAVGKTRATRHAGAHGGKEKHKRIRKAGNSIDETKWVKSVRVLSGLRLAG